MGSSARAALADFEELPEYADERINSSHEPEFLVADAVAVKVGAMLDFLSAFIALSVLVSIAVRLDNGFLRFKNLAAAAAVAAFAQSGFGAGCRNGRVNNNLMAERVNRSCLALVAAGAGQLFLSLLGAGGFLCNDPSAAPVVAEGFFNLALLFMSADLTFKGFVSVVNAGHGACNDFIVMLFLRDNFFSEDIAATAGAFGVTFALFGAGCLLVDFPLAFGVAELTQLLIDNNCAALAFALSFGLADLGAGCFFNRFPFAPLVAEGRVRDSDGVSGAAAGAFCCFFRVLGAGCRLALLIFTKVVAEGGSGNLSDVFRFSADRAD